MSDQPLITHLYTADPSAHVFHGRIYLYPSHDRETTITANDNGDQYDMADYHVFSLPSPGGIVTDHGVALALEDIPWAARQLWAPDAAVRNDTYYLYFPARDREGIFRIGVAVSPVPEGPFTADPEPIAGSYSIDPCCFIDDDGQAYLYFGGWSHAVVVHLGEDIVGLGAGHHSALCCPARTTGISPTAAAHFPRPTTTTGVVCLDRMYFDDAGDITPIVLTDEGVPARPLPVGT